MYLSKSPFKDYEVLSTLLMEQHWCVMLRYHKNVTSDEFTRYIKAYHADSMTSTSLGDDSLMIERIYLPLRFDREYRTPRAACFELVMITMSLMGLVLLGYIWRQVSALAWM